MRNMDGLEFLNGLPVERQKLQSEDSFEMDSERSQEFIQEIPEQDEESNSSEDLQR